jgi:glyoxylase-like metal-dependent hydrolase (beta-lactamase superfamily II)
MSLYFKQLVAGRDFGASNPVCGQMQNLVYLVGDADTRECVIVDPAWAIDDLVACAEADGMTIVGALATHYHPDHVGGSMFGFTLEGASRLVGKCGCKLHCHDAEGEGIRKVTGLSPSDLVKHASGDKVQVGKIEIEWLHTPGHTPGSSCFRVRNALVAGDTLFLQGCGRVDLPGGDPDEMYRSLTQRLGSLPGDMVLYPGHSYGGGLKATLDHVRRTNPYTRVPDLETWRRVMG